MSLWTPYTEKPLDLSRSGNNSRLLEETLHEPAIFNGYQYYNGIPVIYPYIPPSVQILPSPPHTKSISPQSGSKTPSLPELCDSFDDKEYAEYEKHQLDILEARNGGMLLGSNPRMRRVVQTSEAANEVYRKQREQNNRAAKNSRDKRKLRELKLEIRVAYLKKKTAELRARLAQRFCDRCLQ